MICYIDTNTLSFHSLSVKSVYRQYRFQSDGYKVFTNTHWITIL